MGFFEKGFLLHSDELQREREWQGACFAHPERHSAHTLRSILSAAPALPRIVRPSPDWVNVTHAFDP